MSVAPDRKAEYVAEFRRNLQAPKYRRRPIREILPDRIAQIRGKNLADINETPDSLLHTLDWALSNPESTDPNDLATYLSELIRLMENAGAGLDFRDLIDNAIAFYNANSQPAIDLYLAQVEYLRLTDTESKKKEDTLSRAIAAAQTPSDRIKVRLRLMQYYIDTSQYESSLEEFQRLEYLCMENDELKTYLPKLYDLTGITHFYHFDFVTAQDYLSRAATLADRSDDHTAGEALHYLGRIFVERGEPLQAMYHFIKGWERQPNNVADSGWYHLRMGNLLVELGLIDQAKDHIGEAQELFRRIKYDGSAFVQVMLAWGDCLKAERSFSKAEEHYVIAINHSKITGFYRGELLSLVKLFWLQLINMKRIDKAILTFSRAMIHPEIWRNIGIQLILQYVLRVIAIPVYFIIKKPFNVAGVATSLQTPIQSCLCPIHLVTSDLAARTTSEEQ